MTLHARIGLLAALVLLAPFPLHATVLLRCGGGSVATDGFVINGLGEVVFSEDSILCNPPQPAFPEPLALSILSPEPGTTIVVGGTSYSLEVQAGIANFDPRFDTCQLLVQPPAPNPSSAPVAMEPLDGIATTTVDFTAWSWTGVHTLQLFCTREVAGQQVLIPPLTRHVNLVTAVAPPFCSAASAPTIFSPVTQYDFTAPYGGSWADPGAGGFGGSPDQPLPWRYWYFQNRFSHGALSGLELKTWVFRPPADARAALLRGPTGTPGIAVALSDCPGKYLDVPAACRSGSGNLRWSTRAGDDPATYCLLEAGRDYILSAAAFDLAALIASGGTLYQAGPACVGQPCSVVELYQVGNWVE